MVEERESFVVDDDDDDLLSDFTKYKLTKLFWRTPCPVSPNEQPFVHSLWVFWSRDHDDAERPQSLSGNPDSVPETMRASWVIRDKMKQALLVLSSLEDVLVQFWAPIMIEGQCFLTTANQPFGLSLIDKGLCSYRMLSLDYKFLVDGDSEEDLGLPGRVFRQKLPEWTPDVRYYSSKEYPLLDHAVRCNVWGSLALPVFDPSGQCCVGVLELVMTSKICTYAFEARRIGRALKAVNLECSEVYHHSYMQICSEGRQQALDEILMVLKVLCHNHKLPLAQTWVPCRHCNVVDHDGGMKNSCTSFHVSCIGQVMSTIAVAFCDLDTRMRGFRKACSEHHLQKGQGVVGRAFLTYNSCFCRDITQLSITEYPLVHYARTFGLTSCFAICLQSTYTNDDVYILEFFLSPNSTDGGDPRTVLDSLSATMKQHFRSLKVASGEELGEELSVEEVKVSINEKLDSFQVCQSTRSPPRPKALQTGGVMVLLDSADQQLMVEVDSMDHGGNVVSSEQSDVAVTYSEKKGTTKTSKREHRKTEVSISYEVLEQHFGRKLEDVADSLDISQSELKRICTQHGIKWWPCHKRNKDNCSLSMLMHVNESAQGAEGALIQTPWPGSWNRSSQHNSSVAFQQTEARPSAAYSVPDALASTQPETPLGVTPTENVGSKNNFRALHPSSAEASLEEQTPQSSWADTPCFDPGPKQAKAALVHTTPHATAAQDAGIVTMKATYGEDMIKFRLSSASGMVELEEEVTKRLKLKVGTFTIKYQAVSGWILIACNKDLWDCMDISRSLGNTTIRLLVEPIFN